MVTGDNESPSQVPEFLTGRIPSRSHLNQSYEDINLDTTIPAHERIATTADPDPITRLADVLTTMQNRPTAQQLTIRPVNSNTMTFDSKNEKFELFEDLFHTMIKIQPEMTEQIKINHFHSPLRKIEAHLEREMELNALEESDDLPMATMTSSSAKPKTPLTTGQMSDITCNYCKEKGHMVKDCEKLKKKKEKDAQQGKQTQKKTYPECGTCGKKNHPEESCWQCAGAHLKPKGTRSQDSTDNKPNSKAQKPQNKPTSSSSQSSSSNDESTN